MDEPDIPVAIPFPVAFNVDFDDDEPDEIILPTRSPVLNKNQMQSLKGQGFTEGLGQALSDSLSDFALRIWVIDNSGSMANNDGQKLVADSLMGVVRSIPCTRWSEIQQTVEYHAQMAALMKAPSRFRLLNDPGRNVGPQIFSIGENGDATIDQDLVIATDTMSKARPMGATPLITHINAIRDEVERMAPALRREGRRVAIILATDGLPTNPPGVRPGNERQNFTAAMKSLEGLPVWIVIRLCTDSEQIVDYYNDLDKQLELSIEVLDNYTDEAKEMYHYNPWLNYTLQLHRMREMGFQKRLFDILDERPCTLAELHEFCVMLFGEEKLRGVPSPELDFKEFCKGIKKIVKTTPQQWHPARMTMKGLVSVDKMQRVYGEIRGCTIM
mmetsp:Transcript_12736/g.19289  ORF Transcript_12736/g.19289 Transcript_12736/m.19289 type:complete len:386 (+) Transcript_12736:124-1281(+)